MSEYIVDIAIGEERHLFGVVDEFIFEKEYETFNLNINLKRKIKYSLFEKLPNLVSNIIIFKRGKFM